MRLYPDSFPEIANEPTSDNFEVVYAGVKGEGLITKKAFKQGEVVFAFTGVVLPEQNLHTLQYRHNLFIYDPYVMGKVLHCCEPNMICSMFGRYFMATRDIEPGEYLTMDYEQTEDDLYRKFECHCGATNCRKYIAGRKTGGRGWKVG